MKIITIGHTKGGVGKSTILVNLAIFLSNNGYNVRVADCDPNKVSTFISKIRATNPNLKNFKVYSMESVHQLENFCNTPFDGISLIDTAGVDNPLTRQSIILSDLTIVPVGISITEVMGFRTFCAIVKSLEVKNDKIKVLINQASPRAKNFDSFKSQLGGDFECFSNILPRLGDFVHSFATGKGVIEIKDKEQNICKAGVRFNDLAIEILEILNVKS